MMRSAKITDFATAIAPVLAMCVLLGLGAVAAAQEPTDDMAEQYADQSLRVSLWLDKDADQVYRRGEPIQVTFQANEDAYAVLYHVDVDGLVSILWPTTRLSDGFVFGGHQYRLPSREGNRLRVGDEAGVGYVQAIVSRYPFDLRDLALDFHHENGGDVYDFHVAGDPFLAMNEVTFAVTGLEDPSAYVVTNYASYYVHEKVDHPRYLCSQCHDGADYEPYTTTCAVDIQFDYGWMNRWWGAYGFYPAYYYPAFYYVDPWTSGTWVNYWYDPWYRWPVAVHYSWNYWCYDWRYSPYWRGDARTTYEQGRRRYTPLDRDTLVRDRGDALVRTKNEFVTGERPADDRLRRMRERTPRESGGDIALDPRLRDGGRAGGPVRDVTPVTRPQVRFEPDQRIRTSPGLRVPDPATASRVRGGAEDRGSRGPDSRTVGDDRKPTSRTSTVQPTDRSGSVDDRRQTIRPVEPRGDTRRVWTNRRSSSSSNSRPQTPPTSDRTSRVQRSDDPRPAPTPPPAGSSGRGSGGNVNRTPKPSSPQPAAPPPSRPSSGGGSRGNSNGGKDGSRNSGGRG